MAILSVCAMYVMIAFENSGYSQEELELLQV